MLVGGVVVEDHMHDLAGGKHDLDGVEEANKLLMPMALHVAADHRAAEHVKRGEKRGRSMAFVVVGHGPGAALFEREAGLGAVKRLDLALLVDAEHDGVRGRIDIEPDDVAQLGYSFESLNCRTRAAEAHAPARCVAPNSPKRRRLWP